MTNLLCISPGIAAAGGFAWNPTPVPGGSSVPIYRIDESNNITLVDNAPVYNVAPSAAPASVPMLLVRNPAGLYLCTGWAGLGGFYQANGTFFGLAPTQQGRALLCISPSSPIGTAAIMSPASAGSLAAYAIDNSGGLSQNGSPTIYNIDPTNAVPASVPCILGRSPGGHWYFDKWPGLGARSKPLLGTQYVPPGW